MAAHEEDPNAHKDAVDDSIADMLTDLVPRLRRFVEAETKNRTAELRDENKADIDDTKRERDAAFGDLKKALEKIGDRPKVIKFKTDKEGNIQEARPVYGGSKQ